MQDAWFTEIGARHRAGADLPGVTGVGATYEQTDTGEAVRFGAGSEHGQ
jgi:hypothetical protein